MELLLDTANLEAIKKAYKTYSIDGVTTNPSILKQNGENPYTALKNIRKEIGENSSLHVQVVSNDYDTILMEAEKIVKELGKNTYVKIPATQVGIKAIKDLTNKGYNITATAIYSTTQAFMAAKAGAKYVAPYVNRIDNLGTNGLQITKDICKIFKQNNLGTKVLAASFKNCFQLIDLLENGVDALTVAPDIVDTMLKVDSANNAVETFKKDFEALCGKDKTMLNCD